MLLANNITGVLGRQHILDQHFLEIALRFAGLSRDPSTGVGAVIVRNGEDLIAASYNRFPRGIEELPERMADRETKLSLILHAEQLAVLQAGSLAQGSTMYIAALNMQTGEFWGGPPCIRCAVEVIEAGIAEVVSFPMKSAPSRWHASLETACGYLSEAGVTFREISRVGVALGGDAASDERVGVWGRPPARSLTGHPDGFCNGHD